MQFFPPVFTTHFHCTLISERILSFCSHFHSLRHRLIRLRFQEVRLPIFFLAEMESKSKTTTKKRLRNCGQKVEFSMPTNFKVKISFGQQFFSSNLASFVSQIVNVTKSFVQFGKWKSSSSWSSSSL